VWVLDAGDGTVTRVAPSTNRVVARIRVGPFATGIAAGLGSVWVTVAGGAVPTSAPAASRRPSPVSGVECSPIVDGGRRPQLLITSDLPVYLGGSSPSPAMRDWRTAILAVLRASGFRAGRWHIAYQACDDSSPGGSVPQRCVDDARAFALDPSVVGVIGARESSCTELELPILNAAPGGPIAIVSPSNTYVGLTHAGPSTAADEPDRYYPRASRTYARLLGADDAQMTGLVHFLEQLGRRRIFALYDGGPTGYAEAVYAARAARRLRLSVAGVAEWDPSSLDYTALARRVARSGPDAVVLTGCVCSNGATLMDDLRAALPRRTTFIGSDNFGSAESFLDPVFGGMYSTSAGLSPHALPRAGAEFLSRTFPSRSFDDIDFGAVYAAEAARILMRAIAGSDGTRSSVSDRLLAVRDDGLVGPVAFDAVGDPTSTPISVYRANPTLPHEPDAVGQGLEFVRSVEPKR
jgi:branched-chain amino acid transport system substrate-binding protein